MVIAAYAPISEPKSDMDKNRQEIGVFEAPAKTATNPNALRSGKANGKIRLKALPNVAPI